MMYLRNIFAVYFIVFITRCHEVEHKMEITGKPFPGRCINYPKGSLDPRPMACSMLSSTNSFERDLFGLKKLYKNNVWNLVHNCLWPHHNSFRFFLFTFVACVLRCNEKSCCKPHFPGATCPPMQKPMSGSCSIYTPA